VLSSRETLAGGAIPPGAGARVLWGAEPRPPRPHRTM